MAPDKEKPQRLPWFSRSSASALVFRLALGAQDVGAEPGAKWFGHDGNHRTFSADCCPDCHVHLVATEHNLLMRGFVGVTDGDWYRFLAARPN